MAKVRGDSLTGDLLSWEPPQVAVGFDAGAIRGSRLASQISQVVGLALRGHNREDIAKRMSDELGYSVSRNMIDNYASEGQEAHKITLERFIALIEATGCVDALGFLAERFGKVVVDRKYQSLINVHLAEEAEAKIARFKAAEKAKWGGI